MKKTVIEIIFDLKAGCSAKEERIRKKLKISPAEFKGIMSLEPDNVVPCKIVAEKMGLSISRGSRVIFKLMKNGYLKEIKADGDRRIMYVTLAQKGIKTQQKIKDIYSECEQTIFKKLEKNEIETFVKSLEKVTNILHL